MTAVQETVLNPTLYAVLKATFGEVRVTNQGQRAVIRTRPGFTDPSKMERVVIDSGEEYHVNCPFCGDQRGRLYINYRWMSVEDTANVRYLARGENGSMANRYLAHCFNEECDLSQLADLLKPYVARRMKIVMPTEEKVTDKLFVETGLPEQSVPLTSLPPDHPAIQYVKGRNFDPAELHAKWHIHFCSWDVNELVSNRLIFPVYWTGKQVGWQARSIHPNPSVKYYTMPGLNKNFLLYNGERARNYPCGILVEGVFDCFRVGEMAIAPLGTSLSATQRDLITKFWGDRAFGIMLDADAEKKVEKLKWIFQTGAFKQGLFTVRLPGGKDPADLARDELWQIILGEARRQGVNLGG